MNEILSASIRQISEARIHAAKDIQTSPKAIEWIQAVTKGDSIDKVRIEAKKKDIIPIYMHGWNTYKWAWWNTIAKTTHGRTEVCKKGKLKQMRVTSDVSQSG